MKSSETISKKAGLPPGTLVHIGSRVTGNVKVSVIDFDKENISEIVCKHLQECFPFKETDTVTWINVDGLHDTDTITSIGNHFDLHPLLLEEVLNTQHRPKAEEFDNYLFITLKMLTINNADQSLISEQISFVLGRDWVISFREQEVEIFNVLVRHLREIKGTIRKNGADYLLYRLIDTVVDNYYFVTEHFSEIIENLEERVLLSPDNKSLQEIQHIRKQLISQRRAVFPLLEAVAKLERDTSEFIEENTTRYFRDVYEHIIHINESIDILHDTLASIMSLHQSGVSNKMNQVMKVLTIIATIFIPLTFITGIYGMNFDFMPELHWKYGYLGAWGIMIIVLIIMVIYFKRKRWL